MRDIRELQKRAKVLPASIRVGKNGLNQNVLNEIDKLLKKRKLVKIKVLQNCPVENLEDLVIDIVEKTGAELVTRIGMTFAIYRDRK